jgi:hypothetical protein
MTNYYGHQGQKCRLFLKRIKDIDYKGIISSAVAVYVKEGVAA